MRLNWKDIAAMILLIWCVLHARELWQVIHDLFPKRPYTRQPEHELIYLGIWLLFILSVIKLITRKPTGPSPPRQRRPPPTDTTN